LVASLCFTACSNDDDKDDKNEDTLYKRLGEQQGIERAVDAIVKEAIMDADIASYFFAQVKTPVPAGHPTVAQLQGCLVQQLGAASGGPQTYPATVQGFTCRDMKTAHAGLGIPPGTFDNFVTIAAGVLTKAGVSSADVATVGSVLNGTKADIATDNTRTTGPYLGSTGG